MSSRNIFVVGESVRIPVLGSLHAIIHTLPKFESGLYPNAEKAMAPHSSTLAWKIPWTEEPGRLQSMGSLRVRHY